MKTDNSIMLIGRIRENVNRFLLSELEKLGLTDIAPSHGDIFVALFSHRELTMTEIANHINRDRSTVTSLVNKLSNLGYVDSKKNAEDGRSNIIFLTPKGKALQDGFMKISEKLYQLEYQGITESEREVFLAVLRKIYNNFS